ncbi:hypothetical protein [Saccharopolyspora hattusasensis]|uniref:hypothetical protein n=1 Tax=Saccharopolyspora hattusasensis TaxID=1128679 RepID=UPI003D980E7F
MFGCGHNAQAPVAAEQLPQRLHAVRQGRGLVGIAVGCGAGDGQAEFGQQSADDAEPKVGASVETGCGELVATDPERYAAGETAAETGDPFGRLFGGDAKATAEIHRVSACD